MRSEYLKVSIISSEIRMFFLYPGWCCYIIWCNMILLAEDERKTIQGRKKSLRKSFSASEISNGNKQDGLPERSKEKLVSFPPQTPNENKVIS